MARSPVSTLARGVLAAALVLSGPYLLFSTIKHGWRVRLFDFRGGLYDAGVAVVHGLSPYQPAFLAEQAARMHAGQLAIGEVSSHSFTIPVYPAVANLLAVPFTLVSLDKAGVIFSVLSVAAMCGGLWLLGIRDWRCHVIALVSWPFMYGVFLGTVGPLLVLGLGVAWRYRERVWPAAAGVSAVVALKVFPWTMAVWLLATRRYRTLAAAVGLTLVITFGAWAAIGWAGLSSYPQMLSNLSFIQEGRALSVVGVLTIAGVSSTAATAIAGVLALVVLALAWRVAARRDGDRRAFGLAVLAALTATPIVWEHYMVLLFAPIALLAPRLSPVWLIPLVTPLLEVLWRRVPTGPSVPFSPDTLRNAIPWLLSELAIGVLLVKNAERSSRGAQPEAQEHRRLARAL